MGKKGLRGNQDKRSGLITTVILWLFWGVLLGLFKMLYSFFPLYNIIDAIVFGATGAVVGRIYHSNLYLRLFMAVLPSLILTAWILFNLGFGELMQGTGSGWLVSFMVIPASAVAGKILLASNKKATTG